MRLRFETYYRGLLLFLGMALALSLWAGAQPGTNSTASTVEATNLSTSELVTKFTQEHYLTFGLDQVDVLRENNFLGEPIWKYVASLIYIFLAFYAAKILDLIALVWLKKLAAKTKTNADNILLALLHGPVKIIVFVILLHLGLNIFDWSPKAKMWFSKGLILIVAGSLTYLALKIVDAILEIWRQRHMHEGDHKFNMQLFSIIRRSLNTFVVIVAILVTASNIGINITAAITSLSIGGLAVGLAAQDTLANLFGAVAIYGDKPFRVGDSIKLDVAEGVVETVGMRSTRVRHPEGYLITVPNKTMGNAAISNLTQRENIKTTMNLALARNLPADKIKRALAILDQVYRHNPLTQKATIGFNQFAAGNINIQVTHWWKGTDYERYLEGMQEMNLAVKEQFDKEGIAFA